MKLSSSAKALAITTGLAVAAFAAVLILTPSSNAARDVAVAGEGAGVLTTSAGRYEFTPGSCVTHEEDGVFDIEIQGPGTAPDGEKFYFDFSSTANEITIELGVDAPFKSTERTLQAGQFVSKAFTAKVSDNIISVTDLDLVDEQGQPVDAKASLRIDCNR